MSLTGKEIKKEYDRKRIIIDPFDDAKINYNGISYDVSISDELAVLVTESTVRSFIKAADQYPPHDLTPAFRLGPRECAVQHWLAHHIGRQEGHNHFPTRFAKGQEVKDLPTTIDPRKPPEVFKFSMKKVIDAANKIGTSGSKLDAFPMIPGVLYLASTHERIGSDFYAPHIHGKSSLARLGLSVHLTAGFGEPGFKYQWTLEMTVEHPFLLVPGMRIGQVEFEPVQGDIVNYDLKGSYGQQEGPTGSKMNRYFNEDGSPK